jgi:hypothetical protein
VGFSDGELTEEDVILLPTKFDYGCGKQHPLDLITFYNGDIDNTIVEKVTNTEYGISKPKRN